MNRFLQDTARSIVDTYGWDELHRLTIVFPSRRAGVVFKNALKGLQGQNKTTILLPSITTLDELFDSLSSLHKEDELPMVCRLYRIYCDITGENVPLDIFYGWGKQLIADFTNIAKSVPPEDVKAFFGNTIAAKELEQVQLDEEVSKRLKDLIHGGDKSQQYADDSIQRKFEMLWKNLYAVYERLNSELLQERKGYDGLRMRKVITDWETTLQPQLQSRMFVFVGFNYLMPVEKQLMRLLHEQQQAVFYWDYVADFTTNSKAFSFIRQHVTELGNKALPIVWQGKKAVDIVSATTANAQAQYVGEWLQEHYTHKGQHTAIVICDEQMLEPVIYALPTVPIGAETPEPINITKGLPLSATQIYAEVLAYMRNIADSKTAPTDYIQVLDNVLNEVLLPAERAAGRSAIEADGQPDPGEETWQRLLIQESLYQTRVAINRFKKELLDPTVRNAVSSASLLRNLLRRYLEGISLPFHGEPITDIQVMGVLETRTLDFDNLLILNAEEGVIPQQKADFSFIPYYLRKSYSMQTSDEGASVYAYNFFRLLARAEKITILFSNAATATGRKTMSRFLMQMMVSEEFSVSKYTLTEGNTLQSGPSIDLTNNTENMLSVITARMRNGNCKPYLLSPSAMNAYIECPRKFYLQYIKGIHTEDEETAVFSPNVLGSFVHSAMEYIYKAFCHCSGTAPTTINPQTLQAVLESDNKLEEALQGAYKAMNDEYNSHHPEEEVQAGGAEHYVVSEHRMENMVIKHNIRNILRRDITDAKHGLQIYLLEQKCTFDVALPNGYVVQVGGKIDRLDIVGTGNQRKMRVVDYKTGAYKEDKLKAKGEDLFSKDNANYVRQTLVYSEAVADTLNKTKGLILPLEPNLFFTQKNLTKLNTTIRVAEQQEMSTVYDYYAIRDWFVPLLQEKVAEILTTTDFPQVENERGECSVFCPFLDICGRTASQW